MTDQTETWELDWDAIKQARHAVTLVQGFYGKTVSEMAGDIDRAVIAEFERQQAERGMVAVRLKDLKYFRRHHAPIMAGDVAGNGALKRVDAILAAATEQPNQDKPRPTIVCLCGSTRFSEEFHQANLSETLDGKIVLTIGCDFKSDDALGLEPADKQRLDELHLRKIDLADEVLILNVGGYIGSSTRRELDYAIAQGKRIRLLEG